MATVVDETCSVASQSSPTIAPPATQNMPTVSDRSLLPGACLVMLAGQTEDGYLRLAPDNQFSEFIDAIGLLPPHVTIEHQENVNVLLFLLPYFNNQQRIDVIATGPAMLKLRPDRCLEPDLFVLPESARAQIRADGSGVPSALLVVEVLLPSNRKYDLETKAAVHREALVDEIWFVDRPNQIVVVERRVDAGPDDRRESAGAGPIVARSLAGFWFEASWFWQEPPPNMLDCELTILEGPPGSA